MEIKKFGIFFTMFLVLAMNLGSSEGGDTDLMFGDFNTALEEICSALKGMLPIASMLMIVIGAIVYALGQVMGAETRARANVWATAMIVGAIIGILIAVIMPEVLGALYSDGDFSCP